MIITANTFAIVHCTVRLVVHEICQLLSENIDLQIFKFPVSKHEVTDATGNFLQKLGFHQVIGCTDCTHTPTKQPSDYFSYKVSNIINCLVVCEAYGKFINVEVK